MNHLLILLLAFNISILFAQIEEHKEITGPFKAPQEVTTACLECHEDAAKEVMATSHWTWMSSDSLNIPGHKNKMQIGKQNLFNNFCINLNSNWPRCTSCHVGYGWKDETFDFLNEKNVDCLVCHDNTGKYKKSPAGSGYPEKDVDLVYIAQNVDMPNRKTCGNCHFYGGGGDNVKHGDLEIGLINPDTNLDVHMGENDMLCQDCHETDNHNMKGAAFSVSIDMSEEQVECSNCHELPIHETEEIDKHTKKIACQTCHIPVYAKEKPTKVYWDWSTAGQEIESEKDRFGKATYIKKKGSFRWDKNIQPEYLWYSGNSQRYLTGDKINKNGVTRLNYPLGSKNDSHSKIYPFKVHRGKQISDAENDYLIVPQLWGGFWKHFDWNKAAEEGMKSVNLPYSGKYEFVETEMYWRVNHEIVGSDEALQCNGCHAENGRMDWNLLGYKENPAPIEE